MPTSHKIKSSWDDETVDQISTIAIWSVFDCVAGNLSNKPQVTLRNTLLSGWHLDLGKERFMIGEIPKNSTDPNLLNLFTFNGDRYSLDLASNSRNHGRFTFNTKPIGKAYYGSNADEQWKRIIYGSIMHTGCKHLIARQIKYIITDDTRRVNGEYQDDKTNGKHWDTGDSHARASRYFMEILGAGSASFEETSDRDIEIPIQFRIAAFQKWVGKGTVAYNPALDDSGYDLAIPLSSLKGNKLKVGNYQDKLLCGLVFEGEERTAKAGWMLFQWFSFTILQADNIINRLIDKCNRLVGAFDSIQNLAELLRIDQQEAELEIEQNADNLQSEAEYINTAMSVIKWDVRGKLLLHPYIIDKVQERLRTIWLNFAKAAGVRFRSLICQPDNYFEKYEYTDSKTKKVKFTQKVFCAPGLPTGEYIVFCNPMRHWGDCQLWINKHEGRFAKATNLMAASTQLMLNLGRDFDGDFVQLIASKNYPALRTAIANFDSPPSVNKLPKMALPGTLQEVAVNSMSDKTGIVASLLGRARGAGVESIVLNIPPGGMQIEAREMRIIDFLSQELQIAVDSIKSAYPNNDAGLKAVTDYMNGLGDAGKIPWLSDFKKDDCYLTRPCAVAPDAIDTVSRLVQLVNSYWIPANFPINLDLNSFRSSLFSAVQVTDAQQNFAFEQRGSFAGDMQVAIAWKTANDGDTSKIREVTTKYQAQRDSAIGTITKPDGTPFSEKSWAAAYWRATHNVKDDSLSKGSFVFNLFSEAIFVELRDNPEPPTMFEVYNIHKSEPNHWSKAVWQGRTVQVQITLRDIPLWGAGNGKLVATPFVMLSYPASSTLIGFFPLGPIVERDRTKVAIGETRTMKIWTKEPNADIPTKKVYLFDETVSQNFIDDVLQFGRKEAERIWQDKDYGL
jgi:hypothetical protein